MKELLNKEVVIIDGEEYVKVTNPEAPKGIGQPRYLYVPVDEYLSRPEAFASPVLSSGTKSIATAPSASPTLPDVGEKEVFFVSNAQSPSREPKRKVVLTYFDNPSVAPVESYGDWMAEKLAQSVSTRSERTLFVDYPRVREFLQSHGYALSDLETPKVLLLLDQAFGIHAVVRGHLSGPYVFTTKTIKDREETAKAILKVELSIVGTLSGKTLKILSVTNPITASREKGTYSEEKAKLNAIDLAISDLGKSLARELDNLDWYCRVADLEDDNIYINAGRLTGLRIGDVMEVFRQGEVEERRGKVQISAFLGMDASMGRLIEGNKPGVNDLLRFAKEKGT